jgi:uracil-DNA glycosylase
MSRSNFIKLRNSIRSCEKCDLHLTRNKAVPPKGPLNPDLLIIGEAPGAMEDKIGDPFVGRAGEMLNKCLEAAGTHRDNVTVTNTVCCRPPGNRDPSPEERDLCWGWLMETRTAVSCLVGVTVGAVATQAVLGGKQSISSVRGRAIRVDERMWVPTWHPAYLLRNPRMKKEMVADLKLALSLRDIAQVFDSEHSGQIELDVF